MKDRLRMGVLMTMHKKCERGHRVYCVHDTSWYAERGRTFP